MPTSYLYQEEEPIEHEFHECFGHQEIDANTYVPAFDENALCNFIPTIYIRIYVYISNSQISLWRLRNVTCVDESGATEKSQMHFKA